MSTGYAIAYRLGLTPWERAGQAGTDQLAALLDREQSERHVPYGAALDLGCGTGGHALELARRGWRVTGVDAVAAAVSRARTRAEREGVDVRFVRGDVTELPAGQLGGPFDFLLDVGCFHGLRGGQRSAMGEQVTSVAAPGATLLLLAFSPGRRGPLPSGATRGDIEAAFPGWSVLDEQPAEASGMPGPLRNAAPRWYRLRRATA